MGALADKANQNSKFLGIEKGSSVIVRFVSWRFIPSNKDPSVDVVQYKVTDVETGKEKFWTNGSGRVMKYMDNTPAGAYIRISRDRFVSKQGIEDKDKSSYEVMECDITGQPVRPEDLNQQNQPLKDSEWNE